MMNRLRAFRDVLRRLLLAVLGFVLVALLTVLLLAPEAVSDFITGIPVLVRLIIVVMIYAVAILGIYQEIQFQQKNPGKGLLVKSPGGASTSVSLESTRDRINAAVGEVSHVRQVETKVESARGRAKITLDVLVRNDSTNLPDVEKDITHKLQQVVQKQMGVRLAERPQVNLRYGEEPPVMTTPPPPKTDEQPKTPPERSEGKKDAQDSPRRFGGFGRQPKPEQAAETPKSDDEDDDSEFWNMLRGTQQPPAPEADESDDSSKSSEQASDRPASE